MTQVSANRRRRIGRRGFLRAAPLAVVSSLAPPALARQAPPRGLAAGTLDSAAEVVGLDFTDEQEAMMLAGVGRNRESYEALRRIEISYGVEPATSFHPYLPGEQPAGGATPGADLGIVPRDVPDPGTPIESLAFLPVTVLAHLIRTQQVSSVELTRMYLARLERYGAPLRCVVTLTPELALAQAQQADAEIATGRYRGPLHGIPWGAKDLLATRGIRTTWGAKPFERQVIDADATVVERLREAGAVLVAKLSMGALASGGVWFGGSTRNPWNVDLSSSGSSAGPGAATAAGLVGFSIGTETLGSIISPAAACGVAGLRPTYGRVSRYGAMALSWTMDKIGPMCRSIEDCAVVFNAIYGPDGRDRTVVDAPFLWQPPASLAQLRIGYIRGEFEEPPDGASEERQQQWEAQRPALTAALESLRGIGATLEPIEMPALSTQAIRFILSAEAATAFDDLTRSGGVDLLTRQGPGAWPNSFRTARLIPAVEYIRAQRARTLLMEQMAAIMATYDVFVSPTRSASLTVTNLTGHPALALKAGFADGMPVALMFTGRLYDEATLLGAALAYERATPWRLRHPNLSETLASGA